MRKGKDGLVAAMDLRLPVNSIIGVILAGGQSRRFGEDKAFAPFGDSNFILKTLGLMKSFFEQVLIVTNTPDKFLDLRVTLLQDEIPSQGPAGGIATALKFAKGRGVFVVACDMPLLTREILLNLLEKDDGSPLVVYCHEKANSPRAPMIEPLCAIYRPSVLPVLESRLKSEKRDLHSLVQERIDILKIPLMPWHKKQILNVNTQTEYQQIF